MIIKCPECNKLDFETIIGTCYRCGPFQQPWKRRTDNYNVTSCVIGDY